ncbi:hypothetical protein ABQE58_25075 [Mycolicibacterium elephantis]
MPDFPVLDAPRTEGNRTLGRVVFDHLGVIEPYIEEIDSWVTLPMRLVHDQAAGIHLEVGPYSVAGRDIERLRAALRAYDVALSGSAIRRVQ